MVQVVSTRTGITGSTLVRLLARLGAFEAPETPRVFAERLGHWLGWAEAIPLSAALQAGETAATFNTARAAPAAPPANDGVWQADASHAARVHALLLRDIGEDGKPPVRRARLPALRGGLDRGGAQAAGDAPQLIDYAAFRRRYVARQQAMEDAIGPLRAQLRAALAAAAPAQAPLVALDEIMERVLGAQERQLLTAVPTLLERHYERLQQAAEADTRPPQDAGNAPAWQHRFAQDMQQVLLAELEFRWQPIEALLAALSLNTPNTPDTPDIRTTA